MLSDRPEAHSVAQTRAERMKIRARESDEQMRELLERLLAPVEAAKDPFIINEHEVKSAPTSGHESVWEGKEEEPEQPEPVVEKVVEKVEEKVEIKAEAKQKVAEPAKPKEAIKESFDEFDEEKKDTPK